MEVEDPRGTKRSFDEGGDEESTLPQVQGEVAAATEVTKEQGEADSQPAKRHRASSEASPPPVPRKVPKPRTTSSTSTGADRTAAARAASAAKRAAAARRGRGGRQSIGTSRQPRDSNEPDVKKERESTAESHGDDREGTKTEDEDGEGEETETAEKKPVSRRKPGKKRRGFQGKRRQSRRLSAALTEDGDGRDETPDGRASTADSEAVQNMDREQTEDAAGQGSEMDVDGDGDGDGDATPTPQRRGASQKRKRRPSTPSPAEEEVVTVPTAEPTLTPVTLAKPPQLPTHVTADSSSNSSALSNIVPPSPSPFYQPPKPASTVGQQVQVIATKKFQQLSAPLLHNISAHRFANLFMHPVGERVAPGYSRLVHRPMDLKSMFSLYIIIDIGS